MNKQLIFALVCFWLIVILDSISGDYDVEVEEYTHYCEMVQLWHDNDHLPEEQRPGWPPYQGECGGPS